MAAKTKVPKKALPPDLHQPQRDLMSMKKALEARLRDIELNLAGRKRGSSVELLDMADMTADGSGIIAMVKDLHAEIDAAYEAKESVEDELDATRSQLAKVKSLHAEQEDRIKFIEAQAVHAEQLQRDIVSEKKKRNDTVRRLEEVASELEKVTEERDRLKEQNVADATRLQEILSDMAEFDSKVSQLEVAVVEIERLREALAESTTDLAKARESIQHLEGVEQSLRSKLDASEVARNAITLDLSTTREVVRNQNNQIDELRESLEVAEDDLADLRGKLAKQETENTNLAEANKRAETEIRTLNARLDALGKEVDSSRRAWRAVHSATIRTTHRAQRRCSNTSKHSGSDRRYS